MARIKVFTNHYYPENFRINELVEGMTDDDVDVICQIPNYPKGQFFDGYSLTKRRKDKVGHANVKRLAVIPRGNNSIMLILNYLSYIVSSFFYGVFTKDKADYVLVYITSPIFVAWSGLRFAERNKARSTLYLLDLWPDSLETMLGIKNQFIIKRLEAMCLRIYDRFDTIAVSSMGFIKALEDYGVDSNKIVYLPQHADKNDEKLRFDFKSEVLKIVFTGNIGEAQGLDVLVDAASALSKQNNESVLFEIVGDGRYRKTLEQKISDQGLSHYFKFKGQVDKKEIPSILSNNHFGFVSLADEEIFSKTLPAKVQSYMTYGIPILASANGEIPYILDKAKCGFASPAQDGLALANLITELQGLSVEKLEELSQNGYNYSVEHFNQDKLTKQLLQIMKEGK
ncbi:glycosyltransferase family 4 protein [Erysipelothrix urinaevulpis]|uniref:glycosyltransferase family 4 protein n=1 Tax=Erysipelothrix urinaevulpis TaxID=2683717 RepID=UPI00135CECEF|nr:glycosyltransferase family 4 protein [Erysipelothrix urinaevulpis]